MALRWPFQSNPRPCLKGKSFRSTGRRGKYLLVHFDHGSLIIHLGMTGNLRIMPLGDSAQKHDHVDLR